MKTAFLTKSLSRQAGGLLPVMQRLGQGLCDKSGVEAHAFGINDNALEQDLTGWQSVHVQMFNCIGPTALGFSPEMAMALDALAPDLVHTHGLFYFTSAIASQWGRKAIKPYLISPHGMLDPWALGNSRWKKILAGFLFENRHLENSRCIHALCDAETHAIRQYGLQKQPICQIPNGIDLPLNEAVLSCPWPGYEDKKVLLFLSRIHPKKGIVNLLKAWAEVQTDASCWVLGIAGWDQGCHEAELKTLAEALDIKEKVLFLGPQFNDAKKACYQNASGFILPSFSEGLPMVVLEAWAYGLPVLMTPQCNIPEGFVAGAALQILPEVNSIKDKLRDFLTMSPKERQTVGQNGRKLVEEKFTWNKVTEDMFAVYLWVLGGGQPPACVVTD